MRLDECQTYNLHIFSALHVKKCIKMYKLTYVKYRMLIHVKPNNLQTCENVP